MSIDKYKVLAVALLQDINDFMDSLYELSGEKM